MSFCYFPVRTGGILRGRDHFYRAQQDDRRLPEEGDDNGPQLSARYCGRPKECRGPQLGPSSNQRLMSFHGFVDGTAFFSLFAQQLIVHSHGRCLYLPSTPFCTVLVARESWKA
jgi:hypothetical protein